MTHFDFGDDSTNDIIPTSSTPPTSPDRHVSGQASGSGSRSVPGQVAGIFDDQVGSGAFGFAGGSSSGESWGKPPLPILAIAGGLAVVALVLAALLGGNIAVAAGSWLVAGPVSIGVVGIFFGRDVRQRALAIYQAPSWAPWASRTVMVLIAVAVLVSAWRIADWAARR